MQYTFPVFFLTIMHCLQPSCYASKDVAPKSASPDPKLVISSDERADLDTNEKVLGSMIE